MNNNVITLNKLAEELSEKARITPEAAQEFILQYFKVSEKLLVDNQEVTLPGIGSIVVRDNEILLEADEDVANTLNEPFAMFAPMPLDDDFDTALIDMEVSDDSDAQDNALPEPQVTVVIENVTENISVHVADENHDSDANCETETVPEPKTAAVPPPFDAARFISCLPSVETIGPAEPQPVPQRCPARIGLLTIVAIIAFVLGLTLGYFYRDFINSLIL